LQHLIQVHVHIQMLKLYPLPTLQLKNILAAWSKDWLLRFNVAKCKVMSIGRSLSTSYNLAESDYYWRKRFGSVDQPGFWCIMQCIKAANKAMQAIGFVRETFKYINKTSLYCTRITSGLIYSVVSKCGAPTKWKILIF